MMAANPPVKVTSRFAHGRVAKSILHRRTFAFTVVELLVVVGIIAMLAALLLPAVLHSRESARQCTCKNNLHELGVATHNFVSAHGRLPSLGHVRHGPFVILLPFLDGADYDASQIATMQIPQLKCPSDFATANEFPAGTNYLCNRGSGNWEYPRDGVFDNHHGRVRDFGIQVSRIRDGLSKTSLYCEALVGGENSKSQNRGLVFFPEMATYESFRDLCRIAIGNDRFEGVWGVMWRDCCEGVMTYDHALSPNLPSCSHPNGSLQQIVVTASSEHAHGVQMVMVDGSVHWMDDDIDSEVWVCFGTRDDG